LARDFSGRLETLADPQAFLQDKVTKSKGTVFFIRNLRSGAIILMFLLFVWQLLVNSAVRSKFKKSLGG